MIDISRSAKYVPVSLALTVWPSLGFTVLGLYKGIKQRKISTVIKYSTVGVFANVSLYGYTNEHSNPSLDPFFVPPLIQQQEKIQIYQLNQRLA